MKVLIDTCVFLSIFYNEKDCEKLVKYLKKIKPIISVITLSEILASAYKKNEELALIATVLVKEYVKEENIIEVDKKIAELAGKLKAKYGPKFSLADSIILATALLTNCDAILTLDPEFEKVKEIKIIDIIKK